MSKKLLRNDIDDLKTISEKILIFGPKFSKWGQKLTKIKTKFKLVKRRKGDVAKLSCSINKARNKLNWNPTFSKIPRIIKDEISWIRHLDKLNIKRKFRNYL